MGQSRGFQLVVSGDRQRWLAIGALLVAAVALAGCSSSITEMPLGAADAAQHPKDPGGYLPVHDIPPERDEAVIPPEQRAKIEAELIKARDQQASSAPAK